MIDIKGNRSAFDATGITILTVGMLVLLYFAGVVGVLARLFVALALLAASGVAIQRKLKLNGSCGLYMLGSKRGIKTIEKIAKNNLQFWDAMAMWGLTMGFGLMTYPLVKGKIDKRVFALGIASILLVVLFIQPYLADASQFITMPALHGTGTGPASALQQNALLLAYLLVIASVIFGFSGYIFVSIFSNGTSIIIGVAQFLLNYLSGVTNTSTLSNQIPGIAPIIPGINIPLVAGVVSLLVLLVIHEASHGVLARIAGVKLKSVGLLLFGVVPIGAYVEPDESKIKRLSSAKQTRIFSAGVSANFIAMAVFFVLTLFLSIYVVPYTYAYGLVVAGTVQSYPADGILKAGMQILQLNGHNVTNIGTYAAAVASEKPGSIISVTTDGGAFAFMAVADPGNYSRGTIGVTLSYQPILKTACARFVYFLYTLVALSMLLNFFVAVVNVLPVPGFDGWRIYKANIKGRLTEALAVLVVVGLLINALPWLF
jgi:membrane-associated protease RseP (regulator of RpoE activity)